MKNGKGILRRVVHGSELCQEPLPFAPLVEILGFSRVLIENHTSILSYSSEQILVCVKKGTVIIQGRQLLLSLMSRERIVITGEIDGIRLEKRC